MKKQSTVFVLGVLLGCCLGFVGGRWSVLFPKGGQKAPAPSKTLLRDRTQALSSRSSAGKKGRQPTSRSSTKKNKTKSIARKAKKRGPTTKKANLKKCLPQLHKDLRPEVFPKNYQELIAQWRASYQDPCTEEGERCTSYELLRALARAAPYLALVKAIFRKHEVPEDLAYLIFVESLWQNLMSYQGAYGYAQFMPATAWKDMGLTRLYPVSFWFREQTYAYTKSKDGKEKYVARNSTFEYPEMYLIDQRRSLFDATEKMAIYLKKIYNYYAQDSWVYAAFGYNWGMGRIRRTLASVDEDEEGGRKALAAFLHYISAEREPYNYVAQLVAVLQVVKKKECSAPEKFIPARLTTFKLDYPEFEKIVEIKRGDTVSSIAEEHDTTIQRIMEMNDLDQDSVRRLGVGQKLKVPAVRRLFVTAHLLRTKAKMGLDEFYALNGAFLDPRWPLKKANHRYLFHWKLKKGETIASVAARFAHRGVTSQALKKANKGSDFKAGTWITVPCQLNVKNEQGFVKNFSAKQQEKQLPPLPDLTTIRTPTAKAPKLKKILEAMDAI
jgi:LysM repeat protein